jgi:hypothetical protein
VRGYQLILSVWVRMCVTGLISKHFSYKAYYSSSVDYILTGIEQCTRRKNHSKFKFYHVTQEGKDAKHAGAGGSGIRDEKWSGGYNNGGGYGNDGGYG